MESTMPQPPSDAWTSVLRARVPMYEGMDRRSAVAAGMTPKALQAEIDAVVDVLSSLRAYHNLVAAPVSRVPSEVLQIIFSFCASNDAPSRIRRRPGDPTLPLRSRQSRYQRLLRPQPGDQDGWFNITHVCHYWRQVALSSPSLWADLDNKLVTYVWYQEMLRRSGQAPLYMTVSIDRLQKDTLTDLSSVAGEEHISRLRQLRLHLGYVGAQDPQGKDACFKEFVSLISKHAPPLQSLTLDRREAPVFELPTDFNSSTLPFLRSLRLAKSYLPWDSSLLTNLVHLDVQSPSPYPPQNMTACLPTAFQLYTALQRMHKLQTLTITLSASPSTEGPSTFQISVDLPCLASINISFYGSTGLDLIQHLILPSSCHVDILARMPTAHPIAHGMLESLTGPSRPMRTLALDFYKPASLPEKCGITARMWPRGSNWREALGSRPDGLPIDDDQDDQDSTPSFELVSSWSSPLSLVPGDPWPSHSLFLDELLTLRLNLRAEAVWTKHRWLASFREAREVKTIYTLGVRAALSLLNALAMPISGQDISGPSMQSDASLTPFINAAPQDQTTVNTGQANAVTIPQADTVLFPKLDTIIIRELPFYVISGPNEYRAFNRLFFDNLAACLEARRKQGHLITFIEIPYFDPADRGTVTEVVRLLKKSIKIKNVMVAPLHGKKFVAKRAAKDVVGGEVPAQKKARTKK